MTIQITFSGSAEEVRREMQTILGLSESVSIVVDLEEGKAEVAKHDAEVANEPKRGRGRPKKEELKPVPEPEVQSPEPVIITYSEQDQVAAKAAVEAIAEVIPNPEPEVETATTPVPGNAQDLMTAAMGIVAGSSTKKMKLVELLKEFNAKTINTLALEHYAEFWKKVNQI